MNTRARIALSIALLACGAKSVLAQDFILRTVSVNGRQIQESRLGTTTRAPASGLLPNSGLLHLVVTNGPVAGTTTLAGALLDGGTLFNGGALPAYTNIVAQGSVFSLGGGCQRGNLTEFPYISANRPQIARFDANTGLFSTFTPSIAGTDQFDSADCAVDTNGTIYVFTNRTRARVEVYKDNGSGLQPVQTTALNGFITPFSGGLRPSMAVGRFNGDETVDIAVMNSAGTTVLQTVNTDTGALGTPCPIFTSTPPTVFTKPRETVLFVPNSPSNNVRVAVGDFNLDGTPDIVTVNPAGGCATTVTSGPAGSANGGNGYNWTGYSVTQVQSGAPVHLLWASHFYLNNGAALALPAPITSPFVGRGGPFDGCAGIDIESGPTFLTVGTGASNTQEDFTLIPGYDLSPNIGWVYKSDMESTGFVPLRHCGASFSF